jgi:hypothetical protein
LRIDDEYLLVTAKSGTTFTVTRAAEGSTATSHSNGATVTHVLTAGGLTQALIEVEGGLNNLFVGTMLPHMAEDAVAPNSNNGAFYHRFRVDDDIEVDTAFINILTSSGNIEIAIYNAALSSKLATTGSVASPGTGERSFALTTPLSLTAGTVYYAALWTSSATFRCTGEASTSGYYFGGGWQLHGLETSLASGLPATPSPTWEGTGRGWCAILFNDAA